MENRARIERKKAARTRAKLLHTKSLKCRSHHFAQNSVVITNTLNRIRIHTQHT